MGRDAAQSVGKIRGSNHGQFVPVTSSLGSPIWVHSSAVHGQGVFATRHIAAGETVIEYVGEVITMAEAIARHPHDAANPDHTFYFHLDDGRVIDALAHGNASKWINHSCGPNCVPDEVQGRIFIQTRRPVFKGEELTFDYGLFSDEPMSEALKARYACRCGAKKCRGTMLALR
ncbi:SET domain-containing protein-lysine N-methyltransferase [Limnohabitans sp. Hippo3]|nr:SET domain-containing protein-lysine N-methyltransferase [Limnohabitans sp. Hippo3]